MVRPIKKVQIKINVPAGEYCEYASYRCPMLQNNGNIPGDFCVLIPEALWFNHAHKKHEKCPSLLSKANSLTDDDLKNIRLRQLKKAVKDHTFNPHSDGESYRYGI